MTQKNVQAAYQAIVDGNIAQARNLLQALVRDAPSADVYYYAAFVTQNPRQAHKLLRKAMQLDPFHAGANRLHHQLEKHGDGVRAHARPDPPQGDRPLTTQEIDNASLAARRSKRARRNRRGFAMFFVGSFISSVISAWFLMFLLGLGSRFVNPVAEQFGGGATIRDYEGTPIAEISNPASIPDLPAALSAPLRVGAENTTGEVLRDGVLHEYTFNAISGDEVAVALQFFSPFAEDVIANVAVLDPNDDPAGDRCERQIIIDAQTGAAYICEIDISGGWTIRVFGREGASSGVYVVSAERLRVIR